MLGVMPTLRAMDVARDQGLDLILIAPQADPPVCRIKDYGKHKYEESVREKEAHKHQHQTKVKEIRIRPKTDTGDLEIKVGQARKFLEEGNKVNFVLQFRGREGKFQDLAVQKMRDIAASLEDVCKLENGPSSEGRRMSMLLNPKRKGAV
jgi:translation initiation factor IF-3